MLTDTGVTSTCWILLLEDNVQNFHSFLLTSLNVQEGMHVGIPSKAVCISTP